MCDESREEPTKADARRLQMRSTDTLAQQHHHTAGQIGFQITRSQSCVRSKRLPDRMKYIKSLSWRRNVSHSSTISLLSLLRLIYSETSGDRFCSSIYGFYPPSGRCKHFFVSFPSSLLHCFALSPVGGYDCCVCIHCTQTPTQHTSTHTGTRESFSTSALSACSMHFRCTCVSALSLRSGANRCYLFLMNDGDAHATNNAIRNGKVNISALKSALDGFSAFCTLDAGFEF